jgi:predicted DNA-binding ribbon-helix-helix protein
VKTSIYKRSIKVRVHLTSVSLEDAFWDATKEIADLRGITAAELVTEIDTDREQGNLSSAIRLFMLYHYMVSRTDL